FYALIAEEREGRLEDFVIEIDSAGRERARWSIAEALRRSPFASLASATAGDYDRLHTNEIVPLGGPPADATANRIPAFRAGAVLLSLRNPSALAVLDLERRRITWAYAGLF